MSRRPSPAPGSRLNAPSLMAGAMMGKLLLIAVSFGAGPLVKGPGDGPAAP